jgi:hypothetical protein
MRVWPAASPQQHWATSVARPGVAGGAVVRLESSNGDAARVRFVGHCCRRRNSDVYDHHRDGSEPRERDNYRQLPGGRTHRYADGHAPDATCIVHRHVADARVRCVRADPERTGARLPHRRTRLERGDRPMVVGAPGPRTDRSAAGRRGSCEIDTDCRLVAGADSFTDSEDLKYVNLAVTLEVMDRDGSQSAPTTRTVRLYTNSNCGF